MEILSAAATDSIEKRALFALLELHPEPALLLDCSTIVSANSAFNRLFSSSSSSQTKQLECLFDAQHLHASALRVLQRNACQIENLQTRSGGEVLCITLTPLRAGQYIRCTLRNICDPEPRTLWSAIESDNLLRSAFSVNLPLGISELNSSGDDFTWIYINPPTRTLLSSVSEGVAVILDQSAKNWWLPYMLSLDEVGRFAHFEAGAHTFPACFSAVSLKRIDDSPTGAARFAWILDKEPPVQIPSNAKELENLVQARTRLLDETMRAKSQFTTTISHEIRTPLTGIMGSLNLLEDTTLSHEQKQLLRVAQLCGEQLMVLVNDVLDRTKLDEGKVQLECTQFDLHELLADSLESFSTTAAGKGIELILDILPDVPHLVIGDPFRLRQILVNLIGNALKFTKEGHILLRASVAVPEVDLKLHMQVEDTGMGICSVAAAKLFQPFEQADQSMTRRFGGTGLGLSIAQQLAHMMHGNIWFESLEGKGSTFHFTAVLQRGSSSPPQSPRELPLGNGRQLLLVARDAVFRSLLASKLSSWGFQVAAVASSPEALLLPRASVRILVADLTDHPGDARLLQEFEATAATTVVLLRLGGEEERLKQLLHKTKAIIIYKPVRTNELYRAVLAALDPSSRAEAMTPFATVPAVMKADRPQLHILIAEDNVTNQLILSKMLGRLGQKNVTLVTDGKQAVEACQTCQFDLVFMDVMMPVMDGLEATQRIRSLGSSNAEQYICGVTANVFQEEHKKYLQAGMNLVITKPIQAAQLERAVESAVGLGQRGKASAAETEPAA